MIQSNLAEMNSLLQTKKSSATRSLCSLPEISPTPSPPATPPAAASTYPTDPRLVGIKVQITFPANPVDFRYTCANESWSGFGALGPPSDASFGGTVTTLKPSNQGFTGSATGTPPGGALIPAGSAMVEATSTGIVDLMSVNNFYVRAPDGGSIMVSLSVLGNTSASCGQAATQVLWKAATGASSGAVLVAVGEGPVAVSRDGGNWVVVASL